MTPYYERDGITILTYPAVCDRLSVWALRDCVNRSDWPRPVVRLASGARTCPSACLGHQGATSRPPITLPSVLATASSITRGRGVL